MKSSACVAAILSGMVCLVGCSRSSTASFRKEYRMQVTVGPQTYWGIGAEKFAQLVREKTGGRIQIKPYYGGQLLKGAQLHSAQMVASGAIDLAFESTINTAPVIPEMDVFSLPFFVRTFKRLDRLEQGETGRLIFEAMRRKGLQPLAWGENGFRQLTNSRRPIRAPEDLNRLKIRVVGSAIFLDIFRSMGADPVNMNWGDAVTALQQKTVDGQENPLGIITGIQMEQFQSHVTLWNYLADPLILYWSRAQWDAFPKDIQEAIRAAALEAARFEKALCRAGLDDGVSLGLLEKDFQYQIAIPDPVKWLEDRGMAVARLSEDELQRFYAATRGVREDWMGRLGGAVLDAARKDLGAE